MEYMNNQQLITLKASANYRTVVLFMACATLLFSSVPANGYSKGDIILTASCLLLSVTVLHTHGILNTLIEFLIRYDRQPRQGVSDEVKTEVSQQVIGFNVVAGVISILAISLLTINRVIDPLFYPDSVVMVKLLITVANIAMTLISINTSPINILNQVQKEN